jgi:hypothetical protein
VGTRKGSVCIWVAESRPDQYSEYGSGSRCLHCPLILKRKVWENILKNDLFLIFGFFSQKMNTILSAVYNSLIKVIQKSKTIWNLCHPEPQDPDTKYFRNAGSGSVLYTMKIRICNHALRYTPSPSQGGVPLLILKYVFVFVPLPL